MNINILKETLQLAGVTGAGGAGFPTYAKLNTNANIAILNCAECEPLLKLHRQLLKEYAPQILEALSFVCETVGIKEFVIAIKKGYKDTIAAVENEIDEYKNGRLYILNEVYPSGDEVILTYNVTKRIVPAGGIPIDVGVVVFNVETMFNVYKTIKESKNVTHKYVTLTGEIKTPLTLKVPLGTKFSELIKLCGGKTCEETALIQGGPMTGRLAKESDVVSKTTNAILVMPKDHSLINNKNQKMTISVKRAMSACCQCKSCTEMCPRNLLGHPINPSDFMKSLTSTVPDTNALLNTLYCSQCGVCESYACPQGLNPATLIGIYKLGLAKEGIRPEKLSPPKEARNERKYRQIPMHRLIERLDVGKYNVSSPLCEKEVKVDKVKIALSQSIGAPARAIVKVGDKVKLGDLIAEPVDKTLSLALHSSIDGTICSVTDTHIQISAK